MISICLATNWCSCPRCGPASCTSTSRHQPKHRWTVIAECQIWWRARLGFRSLWRCSRLNRRWGKAWRCRWCPARSRSKGVWYARRTIFYCLLMWYLRIIFWMDSCRNSAVSGKVRNTSSLISLYIFFYCASCYNVGFSMYVSTIDK